MRRGDWTMKTNWKRVIAWAILLVAAWGGLRAGAADAQPAIGSPYAPGQIIPARADGAKEAEGRPAKGPRRALLPHESRRKDGAIPGLVVYPFGKTASGERTHLYRVMGAGGVVADFLDYGARLYRLYLPDATGVLSDAVSGARASVVDYEKSGDVAPVWRMTPIRRPRATGVAFAREGTSATVVYWLDAQNRLTVESTLGEGEEGAWDARVSLAPLTGGRALAVASPAGAFTLAATTNAVEVALRPATNATQRVELRLKGAQP